MTNSQQDHTIFFQNLHALTEKQGTAQLSRVLNVQPVVLYRWRSGARVPRGPTRAAVQVLAHLHKHYPDIYDEVCAAVTT